MQRSDLAFRAKVGAIVALWFAGVYGGADLLMRGTTDLASVWSPWDERLPFWPSWALVYLSVTPFLCLPLLVMPDRLSLKVLALVLMIETLIAGIVFVIYPVSAPLLADGPLPALFRLADRINLDLNNLPSLHVALTVTTFLALRPLLGRAGLPVTLWATAICLSTLLTRQHDLASCAAGLALAAIGHWGIAPLVRRGFAGPG